MQADPAIAPDGTMKNQVHFAYLAPAGTTAVAGTSLGGTPELRWKIACVPAMVEMGRGRSPRVPWQRTGETRAVTCPLCRQTEVFLRQQGILEAALASRGGKP